MGILFEPDGFWTFLVLTIILGGLGAFATGRAIAGMWRPLWRVAAYMAPLAAAVRFLHYALFQEPLLDPVYFLVAYAVCLGLGALGWRHMRAAQMVRQYSWAYARSGPFGWAEKSGV